MIRSVRIAAFKCFVDEMIDLAALTLLTGVNGAGKSSLVQALLLAECAAYASEEFVALNGPHGLELGQVHDVLSQSAKERIVRVELHTVQPGTVMWAFDAQDDDARIMPFNGKDESVRSTEREALRLTYLCAERTGPRDISPVQSVPGNRLGVGTHGEFTPQVLEARDSHQVRSALRHPRTAKEGNVVTLRKQTELWMQDLVPGIELRTEMFSGTNAVGLRVRRRDETVDFLRPTNLAFGLSAALPIIVAGLLAKEGSLFIVDAPESHLHPRAQSLMGRFLATVAASGVQVVVETHSDHVLNGVRLAVVDGPIISYDTVVVQFFHGDPSRETRAERIDVRANGSLSSRPEGFFDQSERDLAHLVRLRRGH